MAQTDISWDPKLPCKEIRRIERDNQTLVQQEEFT